MLDRVEHPQPGIGAVARYQYHLDPVLAQPSVETEQLFHQQEGIAGAEDFVLMVDLVLTVVLDALIQINPVAFAQVEQRPRRNRYHQLIRQTFPHISLQAF
ncbi:hypothetical protein D3C81_2015450 [compost metagenome]